MKKNVGSLDRNIRMAIVAVVVILYFTGTISGTTAIVLGLVALILLITSFINFCPIWAALGINTLKKKFKGE